MSKYKLPVIYPKTRAKQKDPKARWFLKFGVTNPSTGKIEYLKWSCEVNRLETPKEKLEHLRKHQARIALLLEQGYNPLIEKEFTIKDSDVSFRREVPVNRLITKYLDDKKQSQKTNGYSTLKSRLEKFSEFLKNQELGSLPAAAVRPSHINTFLKSLEHKKGEEMVKVSNRTRNNYLSDVSTFFNHLLTLEVIDKSPCMGIRSLPARPSKHKAYSRAETEKLFKFMKEKEPDLYKFIKFTNYTFMRPGEVMKLQLKHLNLQEGLLHVPSSINKTGVVKNRRLVKPVLELLEEMNVSDFPKEYYLFTARGIHEEPSDRNYFTKMFLSKVKKKLELSEEYTMYGFRHTLVTDLIKQGVPLYDLMKITGHGSVEAIQKYLRDYAIEIPEDYSSKFSIKL